MNVVLYGFLWRRHRLTILLSSLVPLLIGVVVGFVYPTYSKQRELLKFLRVSTRFFGQEQVDLFSAAGAFTMPFQHPLVLGLTALLSAVPSIGLLAQERGRGGLYLLAATRLSRRELVLTLITFQATLAPIFALSSLGGAVFGAMQAGVFEEVTWSRYFLISLLAAELSLFLGALALLISVRSEDRGQAVLSFGVAAFLLLLVDVGARIWVGGEWLGFFSPYGYFRPARIVSQGGNWEFWRDVAALLSPAVGLNVLALVLSLRRPGI